MNIEEGKYYRTRDGRKVGPMKRSTDYAKQWPWTVNHDFSVPGIHGKAWKDNGSYWSSIGDGPPTAGDIIYLWEEEKASPIQSRTINEISLGTYGHINIIDSCTQYVRLSVNGGLFDVSELRAAALTFPLVEKRLDSFRLSA